MNRSKKPVVVWHLLDRRTCFAGQPIVRSMAS
jgi:hypothetical protein